MTYCRPSIGKPHIRTAAAAAAAAAMAGAAAEFHINDNASFPTARDADK